MPRQRISEHRKAYGDEAPALGDVKGWKTLLATLEHGTTGPPDLRRKLAEKRLEFLSASAKREQLRLLQDEAEMVSKMEVATAIRKAVNAWCFAYDRLANVEMPPVLKGCDEGQVKSHLIKAGKALKSIMLEELGRFAYERKAE